MIKMKKQFYDSNIHDYIKMKYIISAAFFLILISVILYFTSFSASKTGYIVTGKLYESYKGSKELNAKVQQQQNRYKLILDSLRLEINVAISSSDAVQLKRAEDMKNKYTALSNEFVQYNEEYVQSEQGKIWNQLNEYVKTYGIDHNYKMIYGANGSGNIMYADSSLNITDPVLEYANAKYDGK